MDAGSDRELLEAISRESERRALKTTSPRANEEPKNLNGLRAGVAEGAASHRTCHKEQVPSDPNQDATTKARQTANHAGGSCDPGNATSGSLGVSRTPFAGLVRLATL